MIYLLLLMGMAAAPVMAEEASAAGEAARESDPLAGQDKPLYTPFIERYILDELRSLRSEMQAQRAEFTEKYTRAQLETSDRAVSYTTSTVNNIFYIIATAASIFALVGWSSLREVRHKLNEVVDQKVSSISDEYEKRLVDLERKLKDRTERIISAQEEISRTNTIHSLWMRAGLEATPQAKIDVYDQILAFNPEDVEALTYKADEVLELGEAEWALNLCDQALGINPDYPYAYYQRACANATLNQLDSAMDDLQKAIELSKTYLDEAKSDKDLENLRLSGRLEVLLNGNGTAAKG